MSDGTMELHPGDVLILYTDGLIQAMDASGEQFGLERMSAAIEERRAASVDEICNHVLDAVGRFTKEQVDDITLLVLRYTGSDGPRA
jgi:serine phosphatase RsbU (regulator of sigma subunit)